MVVLKTCLAGLLLRRSVVDGKSNHKLGAAGLRGKTDHAAILLHDAMHDAEADAGAHADRFGGVEGIEDVRLAFGRDAAAVIADADANLGAAILKRFLDPRPDLDMAMRRSGIDGIVEQVGPYLIEPGAEGLKYREIGGEFFLDHNLLLAKLVGENDERGMNAVVDVDRLALPSFALVSVGLHREYKIGDPADALFNRADKLHAGDQGSQPAQGIGEDRAGKLLARAFQLF